MHSQMHVLLVGHQELFLDNRQKVPRLAMIIFVRFYTNILTFIESTLILHGFSWVDIFSLTYVTEIRRFYRKTNWGLRKDN